MKVKLMNVDNGVWVAQESLAIESVKISGVDILFPVPINLQPGQRFVIETRTNIGRVEISMDAQEME